jgi:hypothetical protein
MEKLYYLLIIILALSPSNAYSQKKVNLPQKGILAKSNIKVYGANVEYLEIYYSITGTAVGPTMSNLTAGAPMIAGSYKWIAGQDTNPEFLVGLCEPDIYLQLKYVEPSTRREFLGYTKLIFFAGGARSGKDFVSGGHGEAGEGKGYARLLMTLPGNFQYLNAQTAETIWSYGYVSDFFVVNNNKSTCVNLHKTHLGQIAKQREEKENLQQNFKLQNEKSRLQMLETIKQLPANDQKYFQGRLSDITILAPQYQQKAFGKLQSDLTTKISDIDDSNARKVAVSNKRLEQETNLDELLTEVANSRDRVALWDRLAKLKQNRSTANDMDYAQLEADIKKTIEKEKLAEIQAKKNEEEKLAEEKRRQADFETRKGEQQRKATQTDIQQVAMSAAVAGFMLTDLKLTAYPSAIWSINGGISVGITNSPLYANYMDQKYNLTEIAEQIAPYGIFAHLDAYPIRGPHFGIGLLGQYFYAISSTSSGRDETMANYQFGARVMAGSKHIKLLGEGHYGHRSTSLTIQNDLSGSSYTGEQTFGELNYNYTRFGGGLMFEWGQFEEEAEEHSITILANFERPNFNFAATKAVPIISLQLRYWIEILGEYSDSYPLGATGNAVGSYWSIRLGKTITIGSKRK